MINAWLTLQKKAKESVLILWFINQFKLQDNVYFYSAENTASVTTEKVQIIGK